LNTDFDGGRHKKRIEKIARIEKQNWRKICYEEYQFFKGHRKRN
jgi:hypothetical protein